MGDWGMAVSQKGYDVKTCADRFLTFSSAFNNQKIFSVNTVTGINPPQTSADFTVNAGTDVFTSVGHGLNNGDQLNFITTGTLPGGLTSIDYNPPYTGELYYVINKTANTFQVSLTLGGSVLNITSTGTGTHTWFFDTIKIIDTHNLGYYAPCMVIYNGSTTLGLASSYFMSEAGFLPLNLRLYTDRTEIYVYLPDGGSTNIGDTMTFTVYQFLDTFDAFTAPIINTSTTSGASSADYGFRISKPGFDVKTCADKDCIISSSFATNVIHKKGVDTTGSVSHSLGYLPSFLGFIKYSGNSFLSLANDLISITTNTIDCGLGAGDSFYYNIFKAKSV
ncbi:MAG: hypothetical protein NTW30_06110 [Candidatus Aenigmarchaeota archaeon]|nr:hypothetical protein [Candidatus Aenigmarchaeota archaeon]